MKAVVKVGLVGVGGFGLRHVQCAEQFGTDLDYRIVAAADPSRGTDEAERLLEEFGATRFRDYQQMLDQAELDAVVICTPIPLHEEMVRAAIERDLFVFLEKPPVPLIRQLRELVALDPTDRVNVGFHMIGWDTLREMKRAVVEGELGDISYVGGGGCWRRNAAYYKRAPWAGRLSLNGQPVLDGPASNALAHILHCMTYLASRGVGEFATLEEMRGELYRARDIEASDTACVSGTFRNNVKFVFAASHSAPEPHTTHLLVRGTRGSVWLETDVRIRSDVPALEDRWRERDFSASHRGIYEGFLGRVRGERIQPPVPLRGTDGFLSITNGAHLSCPVIGNLPADAFAVNGQGDDAAPEISDIHAIVERAVFEEKSFAEQGIPWAQVGESVTSTDLCRFSLDQLR